MAVDKVAFTDCVKVLKKNRIYPFDQLVEAHRYVDHGHKKGCAAIATG